MTRRWLATLGVIAALALLTACSPIPFREDASTTCTAPTIEADRVVEGLYVLPDDGRAPVLDEIERARCSIDVSVYLLSDDATIAALVRAETRGVRVRIILESAPFGGGVGAVEVSEELEAGQVEVRYGPSGITFMHAKYLVIDERVAVITNQNLTWSAFDANRELGVVTNDPIVVDTLAGIFEADWRDTAPPAAGGRLIVSPQNARMTLLDLIGGAERSITLYAEVIRDDEVIDALSTAVQRGVRVRVLMNSPADELDRTVLQVLVSNGVEIGIVPSMYIHAKAMVIDDARAVIGSHNPTSTSLDRNREVSLIVTDPIAVARARAVFEDDWAGAEAWDDSIGAMFAIGTACT